MPSLITTKKTIEFTNFDMLLQDPTVKKLSELKNFISYNVLKNIKTNTIHLIAIYSKGKEIWVIGELKDYQPEIEYQIL